MRNGVEIKRIRYDFCIKYDVMLQYQINNKMKRSGRMETVLMMKYVVSPRELAGIDDFLSRLDDDAVHNVRAAIKRTNRPYERRYKADPEAPTGSLSFILFSSDATWLQDNCLNKLFKY